MSKQSVYLKIDDLSNDHTVKEIKEVVDEIRGIISVSVSRKDSKIAVDYDDTGTNSNEIANAIMDMGYNVSIVGHDTF